MKATRLSLARVSFGTSPDCCVWFLRLVDPLGSHTIVVLGIVRVIRIDVVCRACGCVHATLTWGTCLREHRARLQPNWSDFSSLPTYSASTRSRTIYCKGSAKGKQALASSYRVPKLNR